MAQQTSKGKHNMLTSAPAPENSRLLAKIDRTAKLDFIQGFVW